MNAIQLRTAIREVLHAGKDTTSFVPEDLFWSDNAVDWHLNEAYKHIQKVIRRSNQNYFTRLMKSTDSAFVALEKTFTPSTMKITAGVGSYQLPADFVRMVMIRDLRTDKQARFRFVRMGTEEFRQVYNEMFPSSDGSFLCDIVQGRTLLVRPMPSEDFDVEVIYERLPDPLLSLSDGTATIANGGSVVTFANAPISRFAVDDELLLGVPIGDIGGRVELAKQYSVIQSINVGLNQVTLAAPYYGTDVNTGNYIYSRVPLLPPAHHDILVSRAAIMALSKGKNPHLDSLAAWNEIYKDQLEALIGDIEIRQTSDTETVEAFLEDDY